MFDSDYLIFIVYTWPMNLINSRLVVIKLYKIVLTVLKWNLIFCKSKEQLFGWNLHRNSVNLNSPLWKIKCPHFLLYPFCIDSPASKLSPAFDVIFCSLVIDLLWCLAITLLLWHEYRCSNAWPIFNAMRIDNLIITINKNNSLLAVGFWFTPVSVAFMLSKRMLIVNILINWNTCWPFYTIHLFITKFNTWF